MTVLLACIAGSSTGFPVSASFTDVAATASSVTTYTVPAVVFGAAQIDGTGEVISTRIQATCPEPAVLNYRRRDRVVEWGIWNAWTGWTQWTQEAGFTAWMSSTLYHLSVPAEVQWEARCGITTWESDPQLSVPVAIVRTT